MYFNQVVDLLVNAFIVINVSKIIHDKANVPIVIFVSQLFLISKLPTFTSSTPIITIIIVAIEATRSMLNNFFIKVFNIIVQCFSLIKKGLERKNFFSNHARNFFKSFNSYNFIKKVLPTIGDNTFFAYVNYFKLIAYLVCLPVSHL